MAVSDWSTTSASNTSVNGVNIAENCPPGNLNNALREVMASVRVMYDNLPTVTGLMPLTGGTFTGTQPKYENAGALLHNASSALSSGRQYYLPEGDALPSSPANGDAVWFYTP